MIRGYVEQPSPGPRDTFVLRVSTDASAWRAAYYRCGAELRSCGATDWFDGVDAPPHLPGQDWGEPGTGLRGEHLAPWPGYALRVPEEWASGAYLVVLEEAGRPTPPPTTPDARSGTTLLVVRSATPKRILYKLPVLTYQAYNLAHDVPFRAKTGTGSWCLYNQPRPDEVPLTVRRGVSLHRPGGATGGNPYDIDNFDPYDPTPRQTFVHWDMRFLAWLEQEGYEVDLCTDVDLHRDGAALLAPYRLMVSSGHDEYWSDAMRDAAEQYVDGGGNIAFLSGNTCWWRVEFDEDGVVYRRTAQWWKTGRPENALTGTSFRNGGERDRDDHPDPVGYTVQRADHWAWAGTGVRDGGVVGREEGLVGYECDGVAFDRADLDAGRPVVPTHEDGAPEGFTVLGVGDCRPWGFGNGAATMGLFTRGGTVFNGATTDWPRLLSSSRVVQQVTRNVLDRLS